MKHKLYIGLANNGKPYCYSKVILRRRAKNVENIAKLPGNFRGDR